MRSHRFITGEITPMKPIIWRFIVKSPHLEPSNDGDVVVLQLKRGTVSCTIEIFQDVCSLVPITLRRSNFNLPLLLSLGFQTPNVRRYLDPKNIPKTRCQEVFGRLGYITKNSRTIVFWFRQQEIIGLFGCFWYLPCEPPENEY